MMMRLQTESYYRSLLFSSSDHPDALLWPELEINYTTSAGILTPETNFSVKVLRSVPQQIQMNRDLSKIKMINIYTITGALVFSKNLEFGSSSLQMLEIPELTSSIYLLSLYDENGTVLYSDKIAP